MSVMTTFTEIADRTTEDELRARGSQKWSKGGPGVIGTVKRVLPFFGSIPAPITM